MMVRAYPIAIASPNDLNGLERLIQEGEINPRDVIAILGKTEGNGCVNDFTRAFTTQTLCHYFATLLKLSSEAVANRIAMVMSGGTEGVLSPHITVFVTTEHVSPKTTNEKRLAIGIEQTRDYRPEEIGTPTQATEVRAAVHRAIQKAGIIDIADVHFVQTKCPLLTSARIAEAKGRGRATVTEDTYESMAYSRAASALGIAMATGEISQDDVNEQTILHRRNLYSTVASTSAGIEVMHDVVIVLGNSETSASHLCIGHDVMYDALDADAISRAIGSRVGVERIVNVFAKAEADPSGAIRGARHTMLTDSDISHTRMARAVVGAVLAAKTGRSMIYVSGGAEHQGPPGGGPVAVIWNANGNEG
jgi:cyanuric acid amidohydrolase